MHKQFWAPTKPGKGPSAGKLKDEYCSKKNVSAGRIRRRKVEDDDVEIPDEVPSDLSVSIPCMATARKVGSGAKQVGKLLGYRLQKRQLQ